MTTADIAPRRWLTPTTALVAIYVVLAAIFFTRSLRNVAAIGKFSAVTMAVLIVALLVVMLVGAWLIPLLDRANPRPWPLRLAAVGWGALIGGMSVLGNGSLTSLDYKLSPSFAARWNPGVAVPPSEEAVKLLGVVVVLLMFRRHFHRPMDGLICGMLVGFGYEAGEAMLYTGLAGAKQGLGTGITVGLFRIVATVAGHTAFTGVAGLGVGYFATRRDRPLWIRLTVAVLLFLAACGLHFLTNSGPPFVLLAFVMAPIALALAYWWARRDDYAWFRAVVASDPASADVITAAELETHRSARTRRAARRGSANARQVRDMQRHQRWWAAARARGDTDAASHHAGAIAHLRPSM